MIAQHLSLSQEHPTPIAIVRAARRTLGHINLDPASTPQFNETVRAARIYTAEDDGLARIWSGRTFVNPPGGSFVMAKTTRRKRRRGTVRRQSPQQRLTALMKEQLRSERERWETKSRAVAWWRKLVDEYRYGSVSAAIFVGFTLEICRSTQGSDRWPSVLEYPCCFLAERQQFAGTEPTHGNVIVCLGDGVIRQRFAHAFASLGHITKGKRLR